MFSGRLIHADTRIFDWIAAKTLPPDQTPDRLRAGCEEEEAAYFYLRKRDGRPRGEVDLIWHWDLLCFVEVKTGTTRDVKPAEATVAREYLRHLPPACQWRREVISVYYDQQSSSPQIELFQNVPRVA
jgi:putative endonuclease